MYAPDPRPGTAQGEPAEEMLIWVRRQRRGEGGEGGKGKRGKEREETREERGEGRGV